MASENFGDLLQKAEELCASYDTNVELPRVQRSLQQILDDGQKLWARTQHSANQDSINVKAATLLGPKGIGVPRMSQKLESLSNAKSFEPLEPVHDTDIRSFLKNERDNALLAAIESTKKRTFEEAERRHWDGMRDDWEREKQRLLTSLLGNQPAESVDLTLDHTMMSAGPSDNRMMLSESKNPASRSSMDSVQLAYAHQIYQYNEARVRAADGEHLISRLTDTALSLDDQRVTMLWKMVQAVCQFPVHDSDPQRLRTSQEFQQGVVSSALTYLETSYRKHIQDRVSSQLHKAMLGGIPGTLPLVKSYLNIVLDEHELYSLEDGLVDERPVWPFIYYCIRCGDLKAALTVAEKAAPSIGDAAVFISEYVKHDRQLTSSSLNKLKLQYKRQVRTSPDMYKRLVYCILGSCDLSEYHQQALLTVEDFLWLRLSQITPNQAQETRRGSASSDSDTLTLAQLQTQLLEECGESYFRAKEQPLTYFQILLLTGQFEPAIDFLSHHDRLHVHAVHIAICLYELGILLTPITISAQLLSREASDPAPLRRLNFARLIMMYTRRFEATDPQEALQYYYFLRKLKHTTGSDLFVTCISQLVLDTREFDMLLGKVEADGYRKPGAIDRFQENTQSIIESVAADTEKRGMYEEAVSLYDLADNQDKVVNLLNHLLSQHAAEADVQSSTRDRVKSLAEGVAERLKSRQSKASKQTTGTFYVLLDLCTFFEDYHRENVDRALEVISQLKIIPLDQSTVENRVSAFRFYSDEIRRLLPEILLAVMNLLLAQYKIIRMKLTDSDTSFSNSINSMVGDGGSSSMVKQLRDQARSVLTFAGMIPYRLPTDINGRLVQIEVLMN